MLTDMTVLCPESACSGLPTGIGVIKTRPDAVTFGFRPLEDFPDLMKTEQFLDETRTKILGELTVFTLANIDNNDLISLLHSVEEEKDEKDECNESGRMSMR